MSKPSSRGVGYLTGTACHGMKIRESSQKKRRPTQQQVKPLFGLRRLRRVGLDNASGVIRAAHFGFGKKEEEKMNG